MLFVIPSTYIFQSVDINLVATGQAPARVGSRREHLSSHVYDLAGLINVSVSHHVPVEALAQPLKAQKAHALKFVQLGRQRTRAPVHKHTTSKKLQVAQEEPNNKRHVENKHVFFAISFPPRLNLSPLCLKFVLGLRLKSVLNFFVVLRLSYVSFPRA